MIRPDRKSALAALRYVTTLVESVRRAHPQRMCDRSPGLYLSRLRSLSEPIPQPTPSVVSGNKHHLGEPMSPLHMALGPHFFDRHAESTVHSPRDQPRRPRPALSDRRATWRVRGGP